MKETKEIVLRPPARRIDQSVRLPGSKSITNRAFVLAALANGRSRINGLLLADDTRHMIEALRALGTQIEVDEQRLQAIVHGHGGAWPASEADIFCGNAGTVMRFLTAACCLGHGDYRLDGAERMRARPVGNLVSTLRDLGAVISHEATEGFCPLLIRARGLRGGTVRFSSPPSSQFISAVLMASPRAMNDVMIDVAGELPSKPFARMTLRMMETFGAAVVEDRMRKFIIPGSQNYAATEYAVEPDATAASYFFGAAAITGGRVTVEGLDRESLQGDWRFVEVLEQMGCRVEQSAGATTVHGPAGGVLRGVDVDLNEMPDVAQTLAVLAAFAEGPTYIHNVANLRIKETDRLAATATELKRLGAATEVHEDGISIRPSRPPATAAIDTYGDHRMAMSFALAGLRMESVVIHNPDCVGKTFPGFWRIWTILGT